MIGLAPSPASSAVGHGSSGVYFDGGDKDLAAERRRALVIGQGLQEKIDCLTDIGKSLLDGPSLRLASLQVRAPSVTSVLVVFDYDTCLSRHAGRPQLFIRSSRYRPVSENTPSGDQAAIIGGSRLTSPTFSNSVPIPQ